MSIKYSSTQDEMMDEIIRLRQLIAEKDKALRSILASYPVDSPGHAHGKPGYWDDSKRRCTQCADWAKARAAMGKS